MVIYKSTVPAVQVPNIDLYSFLVQENDYNKTRDKNQPLAIEGETGATVSWNDIKNESRLLATGWTEHVGLKQGETVAVFAPNQVDHVILYLSLLAAKCIISPGNPAYTEGIYHIYQIIPVTFF